MKLATCRVKAGCSLPILARHDAGSQVTLSVVSPQPEPGILGALGSEMVFEAWTGDVASDSTTVTIKLDGPKTVRAIWKTDRSTPYVLIGVLVAIALVAMSIFLRKTKKTTPLPVAIVHSLPTMLLARSIRRFLWGCTYRLCEPVEHFLFSSDALSVIT